MTKPTIVLDTNIVLDWLIFEDGGMPELMAALNARQLTIATNEECINELTRVLAYPIFKLSLVAQQKALEKYLAYATSVAPRASLLGRVPRCRDKDDQKFLELAAHAGAVALVSKDNAVLGTHKSMRERFGCAVLRANQTAAWLSANIAFTPSTEPSQRMAGQTAK
jgi:uncharacterized protein